MIVMIAFWPSEWILNKVYCNESALVALENMGLIANMVSLVLYFLHKLYFHLPEAANTLTNLMGSLFLLSIVGGFISDTYIDRFRTSLIFGTIEILVRSDLMFFLIRVNYTFTPFRYQNYKDLYL